MIYSGQTAFVKLDLPENCREKGLARISSIVMRKANKSYRLLVFIYTKD